MRSLVWALALVTIIGLVSCRAPRDPDLDERMAAHRAEAAQPAEKSPDSAAGAGESKRRRSPTDPPPKGQVERRVYTKAEVDKIMSGLPGSGDGLEARFETAGGTITCSVDAASAPQTVANFVALATGKRPWRDPDTGEIARGRFYDGLTFHRTIANFIIQTGNPSATKAAGPGWTITREAGTKDAFDQAGVLAMVDAGEDSHGSQFFITVRPGKTLVGKYTPFGTCDRPDLVKQIADAEKHPPAADGKSATKSKRPTRIDRLVLRRTGS